LPVADVATASELFGARRQKRRQEAPATLRSAA
jgi:hypothetical protein